MAFTPMMQQYLDIKANHQDALLMFRLGDFYELFFEDARTASQVLEITLTGRDAGGTERVPMCGVPYHAAEQYISRLIERGYSVAICEQTEDPKQSKGLVKREVIRVVTPGTALREEAANRFLGALLERDGVWGLALVDLGTGEVWCAEAQESAVILSLVNQHPVTELLIYEGQQPEISAWLTDEDCPLKMTPRKAARDRRAYTEEVLCAQYQVASLVVLDLDGLTRAAESVALAIKYIQDTQKQFFHHLRLPRNLLSDPFLVVDAAARRNLELLETSRTRQRRGSLLGLLDKTKTAMGARRLRQWIERPLLSQPEITQRLDAVQVFYEDMFLRHQVQAGLDKVYDLERLVGKVSFGSASPRDLRAVAVTIQAVPEIINPLSETQSELLTRLTKDIPDLGFLAQRVFATLVDEPPLSIQEGGVIRMGVHQELDDLRQAKSSAKAWLLQLEQSEREKTGIRSLKVSFNKVFGYYIEVSKANTHLVPEHYERKQTLANAERYVVPALKEYEDKILHAEERAGELELELFRELRQEVLDETLNLQKIADRLSDLDVLVSLSQVSYEHRYTRPQITSERGIHIEQGRHPVVEAAHPGQFVPNDVRLDDGESFILITGPNMAGKSTYMRQTALIVLLAHLGCFVPAATARIGLVDRIFTRIGASDDLGAGQSTFMVEMVELAQILRQATSRSLVLLDEVGRGTSTYDGLSIAEAVMEALREPGRAPLTLFATHYHELTEAVERLPGVVNYSVLVKETSHGVAFLHSVVNRPANRSYGIQVARLAGIPQDVIERASQLLDLRESAGRSILAAMEGMQTASAAEGFPVEMVAHEPSTPVAHEANPISRSGQVRQGSGTVSDLPLFAVGPERLLERITNLDILRMTPLEAMSVLHELIREAKEVLTWDKSGL